MARPEPPNNDNNKFNELMRNLQQYMAMSKTSEDKMNREIVNIDKTMREAIVYIKMLAKAYEKGEVGAKTGKADSLYNDKGFQKLLSLITEMSMATKESTDRYSSGKRLQATDKDALAKLTKEFTEATNMMNEKVGIPVSELIKRFQEDLDNEKVDKSFKLELLKMLKEYGENDLAFNDELKELLDKSIQSGQINEDTLDKIYIQLEKTNKHYEEGKDLTFAPFSRIQKTMMNSQSTLEDIKIALTKSQRVKEEKDKSPYEKVLADPISRYRDWETDRKSTRLNSSHSAKSRMPSSA